MNILRSNLPTKQKGVVLIAGLILLMVITMVGVSNMQSVILSEKMTANMRDSSISFQASESALYDGEQWIQAQAVKPEAVNTCTTSPCDVWQMNTLGNIWSQPDTWWQANARSFSSTINGLSTQPRFVIEEYGFIPYELSPEARAKGSGYHYYKVTAHGQGEVSTTKTVIESIYATQYN